MASFIRSLMGRSTPVPFTANRAGVFSLPWGSARGREAQMRAVETNGTLFAIVDRISTAVAGVEWKLYRKAKSGRKEDRVEVTSHAALDLWRKPNPFYTQALFVESQQQHQELVGEGWWVIARDDRSPIPLELWPVRPDRMTPVPSPTNFLTGYVYTSPSGEQVPLGLDEVILIRRPSPLDPYRGLGPVQAMLTDLDAARYSAEWNRNFFLNSAEPGGLIQFDRPLDDREFDRLRMRWNEQHKGVSAAHRVAILEEGQWIDRKFSQRDMQFSELRSLSGEVIREAMGFPKPLLGSVDDVNRANADAADVMFARWLVVPRCKRMRDALNYHLLPMYGPTAKDLEFDFVNPVPEDRELEATELTARSNAAAALVDAGYEPKGVLSAVGLPDIPYAGPVTPAAAPPPTTALVLGRPRARSRRLRLGNTADSDLEDVRADYEQALDSLSATWDSIEDQWIRELEDQITDAIDQDNTAALADMALDTGDATQALRRALASMAAQAASRLVQEAALQGVNITAPALDPSLTNRLAKGPIRGAYGGDLADVATVTATLLAGGLASSAAREAMRIMQPGTAGRTVATAVADFLRNAKQWFRRDQLGGALHRAQNSGRLAAIEAGPPGAVVTATEVHDGNRCEPCGGIDGTEFASLDAASAAYGTGGYINCDGGIRCRGTVVATWPAGS